MMQKYKKKYNTHIIAYGLTHFYHITLPEVIPGFELFCYPTNAFVTLKVVFYLTLQHLYEKTTVYYKNNMKQNKSKQVRCLFAMALVTIMLSIGSTDMKAKTRKLDNVTVSVAKWKDNKQAAVSYTFDDGLQEHYTELFPKLKEYGIKASFAINGNTINRYEKYLTEKDSSTDSLVITKPRMTWEMIREMSDAGHEMSSHGWAHINIKKLKGEARRYEVQHNDTVIWQHTGVFPRTYFYPGNAKDSASVAYVSTDRAGTRTQQVSIGSKRNDEWLHKWVRDLIAEGAWGIGMTHGISRGYDHFRDPNILWRHFEDVIKLQKADSIWIGTFHDVAAYEKERYSISLNVKRQDKKIIVEPTLNLDPKIFNIPLTLIVNGNIASAKQQGRDLKITRKGNNCLVDINPDGGVVEIRI